MQLDCETEKNLLDGLDKMGQSEWVALVRWIAPKLCEDNPQFLIEIIVSRGKKIADHMRASSAAEVNERIAMTFTEVGVKLAIA